MAYDKDGNDIGGRPVKFNNCMDIEFFAELYFDACWQTVQYTKGRGENQTAWEVFEQTEPYTVTGLAMALGMTREGLIHYSKKDGFADTIKRMKYRCQEYTEKQLYTGKNPAGAIFAGKVNYGWQEKQVHEITGKFEHEIKSSPEVKGKLDEIYGETQDG